MPISDETRVAIECSPLGPPGPGGPAEPASPVWPRGPCGPALPAGPVSPGKPGSPCGPAEPHECRYTRQHVHVCQCIFEFTQACAIAECKQCDLKFTCISLLL